MKVQCAECGASFHRERDQSWKRLCLDCWRSKQASKPSDDLARELEQWKTRAHLAELRLSLGTGQCAHGAAQFDRDELKALRRLVHPDRHGGSDTANRLTAKLNAMLSGN